MDRDMTWEDETLALIDDAYQERKKLEQRRAAIERTLEVQDRKIAGLEVALNAYRTKYGLAKEEVLQLSPELAKEYEGRSTKEMVDVWANAHHGGIHLKEAARYLSRLKLFTDERQAYGGLYSAIGRMPEYEKVTPGEYRRRETPIQHLQPSGILSGEAFEEKPVPSAGNTDSDEYVDLVHPDDRPSRLLAMTGVR